MINLKRHLVNSGLTTIGAFASLSPAQLEAIPYLRRPKYENAVAYLRAYANNVNLDLNSPSPPSDSSGEKSEEVEATAETTTWPPETSSDAQAVATVADEKPPNEAAADGGERQAADRSNAATLLIAVEQPSPSSPQAAAVNGQQLPTPPSKHLEQHTTKPAKIAAADDGRADKNDEQSSLLPAADLAAQSDAVQQPSTTSADDEATQGALPRFALTKCLSDINRLVGSALADAQQRLKREAPRPWRKYMIILALCVLRDLHAAFDDSPMTSEECGEAIEILLKMTIKVNERRSALAGDQ